MRPQTSITRKIAISGFNVCFKVRNHLQFDNGLKEDLRTLLQGSKERLSTCLRMFQLVLKFRNTYRLYLDYEDSTCLGLYQKLQELGRSDLGEKIHLCLAAILQSSETRVLGCSLTTFIYVEVHCEYPVSCTYTQGFILYLKSWLKYIKDTQCLSIPRQAVECFVTRAPQNLREEANRLLAYL